MKFGVVMHRTTRNMGDDIQTYAAAKLLPQVDYTITRENTSDFKSEGNEPVAVIMAAWWLWEKWNWPPAECIIPKLVSMHINNYGIERRGTPIKDEWISGIGGEFLKKYGPIGVRDQSSLDFFMERGFDTYFSGCITMTLPKQKKTEDAGTYVCLVDLSDSLREAACEMLKDTGLEIRILTNRCDYRHSDDSFVTRMERVEELLTQYQNARFVITRRLHVSLPCLAMEVPVLSVVDMEDVGNHTRWNPYTDWFYFVSDEDFAAGNFDYDFMNPPPNKDTYKAVRESLIKEINDFVGKMENCSLPLEQVKKTAYTQEEAREWRFGLMQSTLDKWLHENRKLSGEINKRHEKEVKRMQKEIDHMQKLLEKEIKKGEASLFRIAGRRIKRKFLNLKG